MFSAKHFIWIGLCVLFILLLTYISKKRALSLKCAGRIMCLIAAASEISKIAVNMTKGIKGGFVLAPTALPLHLCSLLLFAVFFITFGKDGKAKETVINFTAVAGCLGSACAILIPTNGVDFSTLPAYQCFVYHAGLLWFSVYLIATHKAHLGKHALKTNLLLLLALVLATLYANSILSAYGTNFMYLVRPPMKSLPFLNLDHGWFVYFSHLILLALCIVFLFHLPFVLADRKRREK